MFAPSYAVIPRAMSTAWRVRAGHARLGVKVRSDVEDDLLDRAGERERRLVGIASVDDQAVVQADVHAGVAAEDERDGVIHSAAADRLAVDEQRDLTRGSGLGLVRREDHLDVHVARRQLVFGLLFVLEHSQERVGVLELPVLDEQGETSEMARFGDDHALRATVGDVKVGADRVGVVVDPRDRPGRDVLHHAVIGVWSSRADRRQDPEERSEPGQQRLDVVLLGLFPEQRL